MQNYFITQVEFESLVASLLKEGTVIAPTLYQGRNILQEITPAKISEINLAGYRAVEPFKSYLFKLTEKVSRYFGQDEGCHGKKLVFLGVRSCDLEALGVYARVLGEGEFTDPHYLANRENILIITADCTDCGKTCFCNMVGGQPYAGQGFDLNITRLDNGYVIETGSIRGDQLVALCNKAADDQLLLKAGVRNEAAEKLEKVNQEFKCQCNVDWKDAHKLNLENSKAWKEVTKKCVECSACNFICPTCTCFLLLDQTSKGENDRHKVWDACLKNGYARVAGGANSRPKLHERLQNRYHCKFDYSYDRLSRYTCVGCGRCIDGCAGNIDMREVYAELVRQVPLTAKLE
jgi:sulfhydrogenase subunit beta (sulfur reductase)